MPSQTGLLLQVATIGAEGYQEYKKAQSPKQTAGMREPTP